jgi:hypothetical protein
MDAFTIYLLLKLDSLVAVFILPTIVLGLVCVAFVVLLVASTIDELEEIQKKCCKILKCFLPVFFIFLTLAVVTPTTKQMCAIYLIPKIANNEQIQNIGDKSLTLVEKKFEEWVNDITKTSKGE